MLELTLLPFSVTLAPINSRVSSSILANELSCALTNKNYNFKVICKGNKIVQLVYLMIKIDWSNEISDKIWIWKLVLLNATHDNVTHANILVATLTK